MQHRQYRQSELANVVYRPQQVVVESKGPIFLEAESILIDLLNESNRIDSNRESECTTKRLSKTICDPRRVTRTSKVSTEQSEIRDN